MNIRIHDHAFKKCIKSGKRNKKLEQVIINFNYTNWAYHYARFIIKGRWIEAEKFIKKDSHTAYLYALNIIKGRWEEAEKAISDRPQWASLYASEIIKGKLPEDMHNVMIGFSLDNDLWANKAAKEYFDFIKDKAQP
jgi:hypothetical protein